MKKILVACEESQTVCKAFRKRGHEAYSCDILPCSGGHPEWHIEKDVRNILWENKWDLVIAHPPCTRLSNSGVRWLRERNLWSELKEAIIFFQEFQRYSALTHTPLCIENPIPHKYAVNGFIHFSDEAGDEFWFDLCEEYIKTSKHHLLDWIDGIGEYDQLIQPWQFGHPETKATCLWLYALPKLKHTNIVDGREQRIWKLPPSEDRAKLRSKTFDGIAEAMAEQWG